MRWTWMSVVAALLITAAIPAGATVTVDSTNGTPGAVASAEQGARLWQSALSARGGCLGNASITFGQLSGRKGEYDTKSAIVTIDPDVAESEVAGIVIHELAHHAHLRCGAYADAAFTSAFYRAQGLPEGRGWFDYSAGWAATPAEIFAEAVALDVIGKKPHGIQVTSDAMRVVGAWMQNRPLPDLAPPPPPTTTTTAPEPVAMAPALNTSPTTSDGTVGLEPMTTSPNPTKPAASTSPGEDAGPVREDPPPKQAEVDTSCSPDCVFVGSFIAD